MLYYETGWAMKRVMPRDTGWSRPWGNWALWSRQGRWCCFLRVLMYHYNIIRWDPV